MVSQKSKQLFVILATINASLGFFLFMYINCIFNPIQETLEKYAFPEASRTERSLFASAPFLGALIGSCVTESIGKKLGRRPVMIVANIISIMGVALMMISDSSLFIIGRTLTGFEVGVSLVIVNLYITEISSEPLRRQLGVIPATLGAVAVLSALVLGFLMAFFVKKGLYFIGYRVLLGISAIISAIKILNLLIFFRFETPFYLITQNQTEKAKEVLELLYDDNEVSLKLQELVQESDYVFEKKDIKIQDVFHRKYRKALLCSIPLIASPTLMGGIVPLVFSNMILSEGMETSYEDFTLLLTSLVGILNLVGSIMAFFVAKYYGKRKGLAILGTVLLGFINLTIMFVIYLDSAANLAVKILVVVWSLVFSALLRPISYLYSAETLPEIGVGVATTISNIIAFFGAQVFLGLKETIGYGGIYVCFTSLTALSLLIFSCYMVETKDKSKYEILKFHGESEEDEETGLLSIDE